MRVLADLRAIGCTVWDLDENGRQFGVSSQGGHLRGHLDAVVQGLPEAPKTAHLVDVKTINTKRFDELLKKGMEKLYPKYWAQAAGYMGHAKLDRAMFIFICKDDDRIHTERFHFEQAVFDKFEARGARLIASAEPPPRISNDPSWMVCKFCHFSGLCHGDEAPASNCRTCAHATAELDGDARWSCAHHNTDIDVEQQRKGCRDHRVIPILLERIGQMVDASAEAVTYQAPDGRTFVNGDPDKNPKHFSSEELHRLKDKRALTLENPLMNDLRAQWRARIV
jgi:hypothetical protein